MSKKIIFIIYFTLFVVLPIFTSPVFADDNLTFWGGQRENIENAIGLTGQDPRIMIAKIIRASLGFLGILAVCLIIYAGWMYMASQGEQEKVDKAKAILKNAVIGLIIILISFSIVSLVLKLLSGTAGGGGRGGPGGSPQQGGGMGVIGECVIESVYPEPGQTEAPRNTSLIVTFKETVNPMTICATSTCSNSNIVQENIRIFQTKQGDSCKYSGGQWINCNTSNVVDVKVSSSDNKTFVFTPTNYLGSPSEYIWYSVYLSNSILKADGKPVFNTCRTDYFEWKFEVSSKLDLIPPQIIKTGIFPVPDDEKDDVGVITPGVQAVGSIKVISQPKIYESAKVLSTVRNPETDSWDNATTTTSENCSANGNHQVTVNSFGNIILSKNTVILGDGVITKNSVAFNYCNLILTLANVSDNFTAGNSWTVNIKPEQQADSLIVGSNNYIFGENIAVGSNNNITASNTVATLVNHPDITATVNTVNSDNVIITAKVAGANGNKIDLLTNNSNALQITAMSGGKDREEKTIIKDKSDKPRNSIIQINFNEAINPLTVSGNSEDIKNYIRVASTTSLTAFLPGKFVISNQYKTVEFISSNQCGVNGCGEQIYCLPENSNLGVGLVAAGLTNCGTDNCASKSPYNICNDAERCQDNTDKNYPMASSPLNGIVDMAMNSLDGNRDENANGPVNFYNENSPVATNGDNYIWSFFISDKIEITPPKINSTTPSHSVSNVNLSNSIIINFNKVMMSSSLITGSVIINNGKEDVEHRCVNLWNFTNQPTGYWIASNNKDDSPADGEPDWTQTEIKHSMFSDSTSYRAQVGSGIKDIYQNCFKPSSGGSCVGNPSCCGGTSTSTDKCP